MGPCVSQSKMVQKLIISTICFLALVGLGCAPETGSSKSLGKGQSESGEKVSLSCAFLDDEHWTLIVDLEKKEITVGHLRFPFKKENPWLTIEGGPKDTFSRMKLHHKSLELTVDQSADKVDSKSRHALCNIIQ